MIADKTNMDIEKACNLLDKIITDDNLELYSEYSKMHFWTNENINAYLNLVSFKNKDNALSVLSSGDHVFNLIAKGILNIDTFDSNRLTEYYALGLKRAMIIKYNYHDFKMIMDKIYYSSISNEELYELIKGLYSYMEYNHKKFWESMISYDFKLRKNNNLEENIIMLFFMKNPFETTLGNTYMLNEENYNLLKRRLINANISFKCANALNLANEFKRKKYDFILLSNILDYFYKIYGINWNYSFLKKYEKSLEKLCNDNSIVFLHYAFGYLNALSEPIAKASDSLINFSDFKIKELKEEEIHGIECFYGIAFKDAIVLKGVVKVFIGYNDTYNAVRNAKKIMKIRFNNYQSYRADDYSKYSKIYFWTNENVDAYLNLVTFEGKDSALSVLASGDQLFNLICKGIMNIDTFDSNMLTEYFALGLKRAAILKYSYQDYIKYMGRLGQNNISSPEETYAIIRSLYPYMENKHKAFWEALINYDFKLKKNSNKCGSNLLELLLRNDCDIYINIFNTYLLNEEKYNLLKRRLNIANISYKCANAKNLSTDFSSKYDFLLLSNILDYFMCIFCDLWRYDELRQYEEELKKLCKEDATIFLKYAFFYKLNNEKENSTNSVRLFRYSQFDTSSFIDEEIHEIDKPFSDSKDAMVLLRVKKK